MIKFYSIFTNSIYNKVKYFSFNNKTLPARVTVTWRKSLSLIEAFHHHLTAPTWWKHHHHHHHRTYQSTVCSNPTSNMDLLSRLWSSPNLPTPSPPRPVLTIPSVIAHQQSRTVLITMGRCNFTSKSGNSCSCTSGSCTSEYEGKGLEGNCEECGHGMSLHCDYSRNLTLQSNIFY